MSRKWSSKCTISTLKPEIFDGLEKALVCHKNQADYEKNILIEKLLVTIRLLKSKYSIKDILDMIKKADYLIDIALKKIRRKLTDVTNSYEPVNKKIEKQKPKLERTVSLNEVCGSTSYGSIPEDSRRIVLYIETDSKNDHMFF